MDKKIVTYCIGGIRCGKFSGWLLKENFEDAVQSHGGIANYGKNPGTRDKLWGGKMYVSDDRVSVETNHVDKKVIGKDWFDGTSCKRYINCANPECNHQILAPEEDEHKHLGGRSLECSQHPANRYVKEYNLTEAEVAEHLALLEAVEV